jgi:hypothetical protein
MGGGVGIMLWSRTRESARLSCLAGARAVEVGPQAPAEVQEFAARTRPAGLGALLAGREVLMPTASG